MQKISELYKNKSIRDERYAELRAQGRIVRRSSTGMCMIHPQYIADFVGPEKSELGIANYVYKMRFENLYSLEEV